MSSGMHYNEQEQGGAQQQQPTSSLQQQPPPQALLPAPFVKDPSAYLASIASQGSSRQGLFQLAGQVALWISHQQDPQLQQQQNQDVFHGQDDNGPTSMETSTAPTADAADATTTTTTTSNSGTPPSQIAYLYLQAAAKQLQVDAKLGDVEQEMILAQQQYEVLEAVSHAATLCRPRTVIAASGILPTLANMMLREPTILSHAGVEFLHCCLLSEHYRYAERVILSSTASSWPRPNPTVSSKQVLRYYYLRGMIHIGCNNLRLAHRCFWTCLTIPAEICSKIMIHAWKKLALVQCLLHDDDDEENRPQYQSNSSNITATTPTTASSNPTTSSTSHDGGGIGGINTNRSSSSSSFSTRSSTLLPKTMPNCMGRMLMSYKEAAQQPNSMINPIACYMFLSAAFYARDKAAMERLEQEHMAIFVQDGTLGLVRQCHAKLVHLQVAHLARVYSVVAVTKLADALGIVNDNDTDVAAVVTTILCQSQVPCDIQEDGMVVFDGFDNNNKSSNQQSLSLADISEWMQLIERVQKLDVALATNNKYRALVRKDTASSHDKVALAAAAASGPRGVEDL